MFIAKHLRKIILLVTGIPLLQIYSQPANLVLQDTTITNVAVFVAGNSITAGPNFTIAGTGDVTFGTTGSIYFRPRIVIIEGGKFKAVNAIIDNIQPLGTNIPTEFSIDQNYPNPFNPSTTIRYSVPELSKVTIVIYDLLGREVETLVSNSQQTGYYEVTWDAQRHSSGLYICRFTAVSEINSSNNFSAIRKMLLIK